MPKLLRMLALLLSVALVAAACGGGDDDTTTDETTTDDAADDSAEEDTPDDTAAETEDEGAEDESTTTAGADESAEDESTEDEEMEDTDSTEDESADDGSEDDGSEDEGTDEPAEVAAKPAIVVTAVSFTDSTVTIRNDGDEAVDFTDWFTCNRPQYDSVLSGPLDPGASVDLDVTALDIRASGGEFGLYTSRAFDSADALVAYVQWGGPGNGRASVAVEAGLIAEGDFIDNGGEDITIE